MPLRMTSATRRTAGLPWRTHAAGPRARAEGRNAQCEGRRSHRRNSACHRAGRSPGLRALPERRAQRPRDWPGPGASARPTEGRKSVPKAARAAGVQAPLPWAPCTAFMLPQPGPALRDEGRTHKRVQNHARRKLPECSRDVRGTAFPCGTPPEDGATLGAGVWRVRGCLRKPGRVRGGRGA